MTQKLATSLLRIWSEEVDSMRSDMLIADLLSLRAAVRRWMKADDEACGGEIGSGWKLVDLDEARAALRAEMAGIDKDGGA